ncbi:MAG: DUF4199 domain-containing protein [Ginsengibacter sp.]
MSDISVEIKWAIIFSVSSLLWMLLEKLTGLHGRYIGYHMFFTNLFAIPAIWIFYLAVKDKKNRNRLRKMTYKQGFITGLNLILIIVLLSPLTHWISTSIISPEYFPNEIRRTLDLGYYKTIAEAEKNINYKKYVIQGITSTFIMGIFTTAIVMLFLRTKEN